MSGPKRTDVPNKKIAAFFATRSHGNTPATAPFMVHSKQLQPKVVHFAHFR